MEISVSFEVAFTTVQILAALATVFAVLLHANKVQQFSRVPQVKG